MICLISTLVTQRKKQEVGKLLKWILGAYPSDCHKTNSKYLHLDKNISWFNILTKIFIISVNQNIKGYKYHLRRARSQNVYLYSLLFFFPRSYWRVCFTKIIKVNHEMKIIWKPGNKYSRYEEGIRLPISMVKINSMTTAVLWVWKTTHLNCK